MFALGAFRIGSNPIFMKKFLSFLYFLLVFSSFIVTIDNFKLRSFYKEKNNYE